MRKNFLSKTLLSVLVTGAFLASSCNKDNNDSPSGYFVKFKVNGSLKQYSQLTTATFTTLTPFYNLSMVGDQQVSGSTYEGMSIFIYDDKPIAANVTYTDQEVTVSGQSTVQATLLYADSTGATSSSVYANDPNVSVVITGLDNSTVSGTFSGKIATTLGGSQTSEITEGEFRLPRQ